MMGHREKLKNGDEWDVVGKGRKVLKVLGRPGVAAKTKRKLRRRARHDAKRQTGEL